jgi:hypothetical protein
MLQNYIMDLAPFSMVILSFETSKTTYLATNCQITVRPVTSRFLPDGHVTFLSNVMASQEKMVNIKKINGRKPQENCAANAAY